MTPDAEIPDLDSLRAAFVTELDPQRTYHPAWRAAFRAVPREIFVPYYFEPLPGRPGRRIVEQPSPEWLAGVWSNRPLITQVGGDDTLANAARQGDAVDGPSTSSSSQPSLMALMLDALDIHDDHRVLEVGTGTGYNTAILCHRLGSDAVTSIEVDPILVRQARERLVRLGYHPYLDSVDGLGGCPQRAPFDRVLATVAGAAVPRTWIEQTRSGGKMLLPLNRRNCGGLLVLLTVEDDTAQGHFLPDFGGFMPVRHDQVDTAQQAFRTVQDFAGIDPRPTDQPSEIVTDEAHPFEFFAALFTGGYDQMSFTPSNGDVAETWIALGDGSWVCHTPAAGGDNAPYLVRQGGPRRLWDEVERLHAQWIGLGRPSRERFGLTAAPDGHTVWLDNPDGPDRWPLTPVLGRR